MSPGFRIGLGFGAGRSVIAPTSTGVNFRKTDAFVVDVVPDVPNVTELYTPAAREGWIVT